MIDQTFDHKFREQLVRILQSGQSQTIMLTGNVHDLFFLPADYADDDKAKYVPLTEHLCGRWGKTRSGKTQNSILITYEPNGVIRFLKPEDEQRMRDAWMKSRTGKTGLEFDLDALVRPEQARKNGPVRDEFRDYLLRAIERPAVALQLMQEFCRLSRESQSKDDPLYGKSLIILIEWANMILPEMEVSRLNDADRRRVMICQDWFTDPAFMHGSDSVILITESVSAINSNLTRLPQLLTVEIPSPDATTRKHFIDWFDETYVNGTLPLWDTKEALATFSAGLSLHALGQLLKGAVHDKQALQLTDVIAGVERYIKSQLGEGVVEFKQPFHTLDDVIGCRQLKKLLQEELIARFKSNGKDALSGAAIAGPIGSGKTHVWEAVASMLGMPVLVLKSIRSQWFGQTDIILEKLYRVLLSLPKVMIMVDEADTVFGGLGENTHETERRLTGTIQGWMSDPRLRGKVLWLLMTARIHLLSPDIRRPGRVGDLIIPMLDPEGEDRDDFIVFAISPILQTLPEKKSEEYQKLVEGTKGFSASSFGALRSELAALKIRKQNASLEDILERVHDQLTPDIGKTRRYQILQALLNTSRRSLHPKPDFTEKDRESWVMEIRQLEAEGIR